MTYINTTSFTEPEFFMPPLSIYDRTVAITKSSSMPLAPDKRIHSHRESNRLLPIFRIYPDLLEYIFILSANLERTIQYRRRTIISYSQTCHDWRIVALSIKYLWSGLVDFEENTEEWNNELLRRSHPYPIVVGPMSHARHDSRVISAELEHLERIRIYRVGFEASAWKILVEGLQQPAPHIEYLNISYMNHNATDSFILPSTLFAGAAPHFKRLEMTECLIDFQAPVLRSLTILSVTNLNALIAPSPLGWLEHLSHLPLLTTLRLEGSMRSQARPTLSSISPRTNQIKLPHLSMLNLDATLYDIHIFIEGLKFPVSCSLMVRCSGCYPGPELDVVLSAYLHRLDYAHQLRPDYCPFFIYAQTSILSIWNQHSLFDSSDDAHSLEAATLCLDLVGNFEFGFWESLLRPVLHTLRDAFSKFTSLELQLPAMHPSLIPCLVRATNLTRLGNVSAIMTKKLLSQIQVVQPPAHFIPLPALHTIVFTNDESVWGAAYQTLLSFLTWRRIVGHPITRVSFRHCLILDDTISDLESLSIQVDCDLDGSRWQRL